MSASLLNVPETTAEPFVPPIPQTIEQTGLTESFLQQLILKTSVEHPQLALAAVKLLASRLRRCAELVETLSLREVGQRLARLLLEEARSHGIRTDRGTKIRLQLTHNQLAARIGTVREVVTRMLIRLQEQGLIVYEGKDILIPDMRPVATYAESEFAE